MGKQSRERRERVRNGTEKPLRHDKAVQTRSLTVVHSGVDGVPDGSQLFPDGHFETPAGRHLDASGRTPSYSEKSTREHPYDAVRPRSRSPRHKKPTLASPDTGSNSVAAVDPNEDSASGENG